MSSQYEAFLKCLILQNAGGKMGDLKLQWYTSYEFSKWTEMIIVRKKNDLLMLPCDGEEAVPLD